MLPSKAKAKETQGAKAEEGEDAVVVQARHIAEALAAGRRILAERNREAMKLITIDDVKNKVDEILSV